MNRVTFRSLPLLLLLLLLPAWGQAASPDQIAADARTVLEEIMKIPEQGIPPALLGEARGLVILPGMIKAGFVIGGRYGQGVLLIREQSGGWSRPVVVSMVGGSVGWQIGASSTDVLLVFKTRKGIDDILSGKFTLGADAAVAAGPVGRKVEAATDVQLQAEIYSYSRSRGLFAGVSIEGASLSVDHQANASWYAVQGISPQEVVAGRVGKTPASADLLRREVARLAP